MITGVDLVREQLRIANGEPMSVDELNIRGHSIEVRLYAEDATNNFLQPSDPWQYSVRLQGQEYALIQVFVKAMRLHLITIQC